ncbi:MAG: VTT domain-containing protein [Nitriliruptorales bacterium]|nr:VTT domain-containing protein [Nitriliruptorales bacterium]
MTADGAASLSPAAARARLIGIVLLIGALGVTVAIVGPDVDDLRSLVDDNLLGAGVYVLLYAGLTIVLVPGVLLTTTAGLLFGLGGGTGVSLAGAIIGSTISFVVARRLGRSAVEQLVAGRVAAVDRWLGDRGLAAVLTMRLVPLVPFSVANWAAGITSIRTRDYLVGTALGIVPGTVAYVAVGAKVTDPGSPAFLLALVALAVLSIGGVVALRRRERT